MTSSAIKDIFKKLKNRDRKSKAIMLIAFLFVVLATVMVGLLINHKKNNTFIAGDIELRRAINYDLFEDGDDTVEDIEGNVIDSIKFGAFFLRDVDGDGYADRIKGTCKQIGKEDTLYMELNVQTEGKLVNGKIEIGGESFYLQTTLPKDNVIKENYIGNNIKTIKFNDIENGTQTMISGIIHAGDYNSSSSKFSALGNNVNKYNTNNTVVLTGTYVVENLDGTTTETEIRKEIDLEIDWYGTAAATLSGTSQSRTNVGITNPETNELNLGFYLQPTETKNELILKDNSLTAEIPLLNGYEPIRVSVTGTNINYSYDELTRKITITKEAELDENGNVIKNAYSSYSSSQRCNTYNISVTYPLEAYEVMGEGSTIELKVPVTTYFDAYNNPNSEFTNPFKTNVAAATYTIRYQKPAEQTSKFGLEIGKYMYRPNSRYVVSKKKPLRIYNELSSEEHNDIYEVRWTASTGTNGEYTGIVMKETPDGADRLKDEFVKADNSLDSMENITSNIGIYFSNATSMLGDDGWIKVYDDETDNLIATFTQSDWNIYTSSNIYYYDVPINHVRIETSATNALSIMTVYHIKELDDEYITENYTRAEFDNLKKIKTNLVGYLGDTKISTISNTAIYEAPYAIADISINKNTISTQSTEKNEIITIQAMKDESLNQLGWINGIFLIKVPQDIFDIEINSVSINNSNVRILSYENYEEEGINYIKIITSNEQEKSYTITVDCNITPDPRIASNTETFELYASCDNAEEYYYSSQDIYDVNGNLNTNELVNKRSTNINLIAPSSLLTNQTAHNYDEAGTIVIAPKVAILDKERRFATVSLEIKNNYTSTISEVSVIGRIPFEGNKYVINGKDMGSNYSTTMTNDGIILPQELQDIAVVYYSENGNASKDLSLEANGWTTEVSDFSKIKSYMIVLEDYALAIGESHVVSYEINIPEGLSYNQISFSHHAVFFSLDTPEGKYRTQTEPSKIGFMIAKQYDLEVIKYQKDTEKTLSEVTFSVQEEGEEITKTGVTGIDGKFRLNGLYLDREYTIKEIKGPTNYELNEDEIKFIGTEENAVLDVSLISGNPKAINAFQPHDGEDYKIQVQVEDEVRAKLKLIKKEAGTDNVISKVKFKITGKGFGDNGRIITTNSSGEASISGLYIGEEYRLEETKAEGYYLASPINFKIENNSGNYSANILEGEIEAQSTELNDYIPTINVEIENEKIPTYDLEITKIKKRTNVETSNDPSNPGVGNEEIIYLQGAKFKLYKNGKELGTYISDENGKILIQGLYAYESEKDIDQTYVLKEVLTPEGYAKVKDITFKVSSASGVLDYEETLEDGQSSKDYIIEDNIVKLTVEDSPSFKLTKKDAETDEVISGVKFAFYNIDDVEVPARNSKGEIIGEKETINGQEYYTVTTDSNGEITADLPEGSYKAVEIDAPEKYDLSSNEYYFGIGMNQVGKAKINPLWSRRLEVSNGWSTAYDAINTRDGGYIVVGDFYTGLKLDDGTSLSGGPHLGNSTGFILKYDIYGHILWGDAWNEYYYGSHIRGVTELENGDIIAAGCYNESKNGLVRKYDSDGKNKERIGTYKSSGLIEATNDGGFVLISGNNGLIKYNEDYEIDFSKNINGIIITDIKILNNSIYIAANYTNDNINLGNGFILQKNGSSEQACAIIECDYDGNVTNCKSFEASTKIDANKIEIDNNTNNIIIGCSFEGTIIINNDEFNNYSNADVLVLNCNNLLNVNWVKQINGQENETVSAITMINNNIDIGIYSTSTALLDDNGILIEKGINAPAIIELFDDGKVNFAIEVSKINNSNMIQIYDLLQSEENNIIIVGRYSAYYARSIIAEASISWTDPKLEDVCELEILNERKNYKILTEINEIDGIKGGFISGEDIYPYERVLYGDNSIKEIKMIPDENYEIMGITVNGDDWLYTPEADGSYTMPAFENMTEDKHIVVTYSLKNNKITINKKDSVSGNALEGAKFKLDQIEERTEPNNNDIIGNLENNGKVYTVSDYDKEVANFIDLSTDLKYVDGVSYYFVPKTNEDNSISYVPTNSKTWQIANVEDATEGVQSTTANSYVELDLSGMTGTYKVVVNGYVSSQSYSDYGYATVTTNEDSIVNISSIPKHNESSSQNSRFISISGTTVDSTIPRDRESTIVLNGGQKYYLHLGYYKNESTDTGEDWFVINSIKLYETKDIQYNFEEKTIGEGQEARTVYESTNAGTYSKTANSYIPLDLTDYTGKYYLTVEANVSTASGDYGYVTLNKTQSPAPSYSSNTSTNRRIIYKSGVANEEKTIEIDGGYKYYLHLGYYKDDVLNTSGEDYFRVNSINISLSGSQLYHTTLETNSSGQALTQIPFGKYQVTELRTAENYVMEPTPVIEDQEGNILNENGILEFRSSEGSLHEFTIKNEKYAHVIVHHYIKGTTTSLADDEYLKGRQGNTYTTLPKADITNYELEEVNGEQVLPDNQTGEYTYDDIVVTYYYVRKKIPLTTNHLIEGTNVGVPLKAGGNAESIVEYGDENQGYTTAAIANELLDDRYELSQIPENSTGIYSGNEVIVNYYYKEIERTLTINKTGEDGVEPVSNAVFDVRNQNNTIFGNITNNGTIYTSLEYDSTNNKNLYLGNLTNNGTYYFVEDSEGKLVPTNSKKWRVENVDGATAGVQSVTANSYMKIDLTGISGNYVVVINAHVSSQNNYDYGYATINQSITAPSYSTNNNTNKRFMYIAGNTSASLTDKDHVSSILEGGKTYYLHLGYRKNGSTDTGDDQVVINSINLYPVTEKHTSYYFEYDNGKLVSNNQNKDNTVANSYLPIDLRGKTGDYKLTVNAEVSSASGDYGYLTINKSTVAPAHGTNDTSNVRFAHTYNQAARDYSTTIAGGDLYYLHLGYYKNGSTSSGSDTFTINSIRIGDEEYVGGIVKTDNNGKANINLKVGTYDVSEITAPLSYDLNTSVNTITVTRDSGNQTLDITNRKTRGMVIVHHYLKDTTTPVPLENGGVAEDEIKEKIVGEMYATKELEGISRDFECVGIIGETSGTYIDGTIEVTYYYDYKDSTVTVHHYIQGTTNSLSDDITITGQITSHYETYVATDIPEYYELVAEPTNKDGYITYDPIEVIYEYKLKNYPYIVNYYKVGTTEKVADSKEDGTATYGTTVRAADNEEDVYGYKIVSYSDAEITIGTQNNVINIYYDVDETQTKELWYIVEYYIDGEIVEDDTERESETVQVLQPNVLQVKKDKINTVDKYEGYRAKNADSIPDEIEHKGVIRIYYVSTNLSYVVNYLEKDTDIIIKLPKTVSGLEEGTEIDATTEVVTLYGYTYDSIDTTTLTIEANTVNSINIYYTRNPATVIIHHYKEGTDEKLDEDQTLDGYYYDMYQTRPNNVLLQEYILVNNPSNASGYMMEDRTEVTYYYKSLYGNIIVQHLDYNTHEPVSPEYTRKGEVDSVYHQDPDEVEGYVCVADSGNTDGVFWEEDITITFYYLKEAQVTVNHIDKVKYDKLLEENPNLGDEDIPRDCMLCDPVVKKGVVGDVYNSSQINFEGYELIEKPDNESVGMTEDEIILNYYYIYRSEGVLEKHVDIVNNTILDNTYYEGHEGDTYDTDDSKSFETYEPVTNKQFLDKLGITEENYTDYGLTVDNYNSILENPNDRYIPYNKTGEMKKGLVEVIYYYIRPTKVEVHYIDKLTEETLEDSTIVIEGYEGDSYSSDAKEFEGYELVKNKDVYTDKELTEKDLNAEDNYIPDNHKGMMNVDDDGNNVEVVTYYYLRSSGGVTERHIDITTGDLIIDEKHHEGREGDYYTTSYETVETYRPVTIEEYYDARGEEIPQELAEEKDKYYEPSNAKGQMTVEEQIVEYYYIRMASVKVEYRNISNGDELPASLEEFWVENGWANPIGKVDNSSSEYIYGKDGDSYETKEKYFENFTIVKEKYPTNAKGEIHITKKADGTYETETVVTYWYRQNAGGVSVVYEDKENGDILDSEYFIGQVDDEYETGPKEIDGYELIKNKDMYSEKELKEKKLKADDLYLPENYKGKMTPNQIEVIYYYNKTSKPDEQENPNKPTNKKVIRNITNNYETTNNYYDETNNYYNTTNNYYEQVDARTTPTTIVVTNGTKTASSDTQNNSQNTGIATVSTEKTTSVSNTTNKIDTTGKTPNTGDTAPVIASWVIIITIMANIVVIVLKKQE